LKYFVAGGKGVKVMKKGLFVVFTGNGKGKTTSALGLAMRALGHKQRVCFIQFIKGRWKTGELVSARRFSELMDVSTMGKGFILDDKNIEKHKKAAREAWQFAKKAIDSGRYDIVILDELTYLIKYKMIEEAEVVEFLSNRPEGLHVVVTGRSAPTSMIEAADMVTEMKEVKHPLEIGIESQKGIEY
jgi:cob(I)alamin adenosyltransferase